MLVWQCYRSSFIFFKFIQTCIIVIQQEDSKNDLEGQYGNVPRPAHYVLRCRQRAKRLNSLTTLCLFLTALLVMSIGVIGGVYIYKQYARVQMHRFRGWCDIPYYDAHKGVYQTDALVANPELDDTAAVAEQAMEIEKSISNTFKEGFEIDLENEDYEKIDVPDLKGGRQGRFIHDFNTVSNCGSEVDHISFNLSKLFYSTEQDWNHRHGRPPLFHNAFGS